MVNIIYLYEIAQTQQMMDVVGTVAKKLKKNSTKCHSLNFRNRTLFKNSNLSVF